MTRRITAAILLTSWLVLLIGGAAAYVAVRHMLLEELDNSIVLRASSLPEVLGIGPASASLPPGDRYVVKNQLGQTLARPPAGPSAPRRATVLSKSFASLADGSRIRTVAISFGESPSSPPLTVVYSGPADRFDRTLNHLASIFALIGVCTGAVVAAVAVRVARAALRPLRSAARTLSTIDDRSLDRRLDTSALPREIAPVAERMNQMLARLEAGLLQRKQFLADAAHELRTPITALTTTIEVALRRPRDAASLTRTLNECLADAKLLRRLVEALLEQFRLDRSPQAADVIDTDISTLLDRCMDSVETAARLKRVTLLRSYAPGLRFPTQPERLRSVVCNLLSNGIDYNHEAGHVDLACRLEPDRLKISVRNTGQPIPDADLPRVFEPFFRPAATRASSADGHAGLGLYLVKSHVDALGGSCTIRGGVNHGCEVLIDLPARAVTGPATPEKSPAPKILTPLSSDTDHPLAIEAAG